MAIPTLSVAYVSQITIVETSADAYVDGQNATTSYNGLNTSETLNSGTTPPVTVHAEFSQALSTGAATISLRALPGPHGETLDANGLKLQAWKFINPSTNANAITISFGASSGYNIFGASGVHVLQPGAEISGRCLNTEVTVDNTHKNIDLAGTASQALTCMFVLG